jgi:hypothetical protein
MIKALIFSQLVILLALLRLVKMSYQTRPVWHRGLPDRIVRWFYRKFTYDPFPPTRDDPFGMRAWMTDEERAAAGLHGPVKGKWYQRSRRKVAA